MLRVFLVTDNSCWSWYAPSNYNNLFHSNTTLKFVNLFVIGLSVCLVVCLFIYLPMYLCIYLSIYLVTYLFIYLFFC